MHFSLEKAGRVLLCAGVEEKIWFLRGPEKISWRISPNPAENVWWWETRARA
jgi:hypothetical protein